MCFREKVSARLESLGLTKQELAKRAGLSPSYVYKLLMDGQGNRSNPSPDAKKRIAEALGLVVGDLDDNTGVTEVLLDRLYGLSYSERESIRGMSTRERMLLIARWLQESEHWTSDEDVAEGFGLPLDTYTAIVSGVEPDTATIKTVESRTGLTTRFWISGRLDPHPRLLNQLIKHDDAASLLELCALIIQTKTSPSTIKSIVLAVAKGGAC